MNCNQCGHPLVEASKFCSKCGSKVIQSELYVEATQQETVQQPVENVLVQPYDAGLQHNEVSQQYIAATASETVTSVNPAKKGKALKITLLASLLVLVLLIGGAAIFGIPLSSSKGFVEKFRLALINGNAEQVQAMIRLDGSDEALELDTVKKFIEYNMEHSDFHSSFMESIYSQIGEQRNALAAIGNLYPHVKVEKQRKYIFFSQPVITLQPYKLDIKTEFVGTKIRFDGKEIAVADQDQFSYTYGPLLIGEYVVETEFQGEYGKFKNRKEIDLYENLIVANLDLTFEKKYFTLTSNFNDAKLYINGKEIGKTIAEVDRIGPIPVDEFISVYAEREFDWGLVRSEEYRLDDEQEIAIYISPFQERTYVLGSTEKPPVFENGISFASEVIDGAYKITAVKKGINTLLDLSFYDSTNISIYENQEGETYVLATGCSNLGVWCSAYIMGYDSKGSNIVYKDFFMNGTEAKAKFTEAGAFEIVQDLPLISKDQTTDVGVQAHSLYQITPYRTVEFIARYDTFPGVDFPIGATVGELKQEYGNPELETWYNGGAYIGYENVGFIAYDFNDSELVRGYMLGKSFEVLGIKEGMSLAEVRSQLGEPFFDGIDDMEGEWLLYYELDGGYSVYIYAKDESSPIYFIQIMNKEL